MKKVLLDTNILSAFMRGHETVIEKSRSYLQVHEKFTMSIISYYEIMRGIKALSNEKKYLMFQNFIYDCELMDIDRSVADKAADIYHSLRKKGMLIEDADILIAATAIIHDLNMATGNIKHFIRIEGLNLENWLE
ncbi:MAG: type II toxin-antitoxin system VapC family toxin [Desulfonatronovibrio sp. MSAO_Bac4]|nr:MAG: type II toxin-antitoxin system VapC family toxin [Desulfonatronovibrio sp. MSAO_Bac4]